MIDYILVRQKDIKKMFIHNIMRAMRGATNHRLIRSKIKICISHNIDVFDMKQNILIIIYWLKVKNKKNLRK